MFPALLAGFFALFGIAMVLICFSAVGRQTAESDEAPKPEAETPATVSTQVTAIINERVAQLDEKLVDLHMRTASQLKTDLDEAEERLQGMEKGLEQKLAVAADQAASMGGGLPSTEGIPDLKRMMQERMAQFDSKLIDVHTKMVRRLEEAVAETEQKITSMGDNTVAEITNRLGKLEERVDSAAPGPAAGADAPMPGAMVDMQSHVEVISERLGTLEEKIALVAEGAVAPSAGPVSAGDSSEIKQMLSERMAQFDEKLMDMHTEVAQRIQKLTEDTNQKLAGAGSGGDNGGELLSRIAALEERMGSEPAVGGPSIQDMPDLKRLMDERLEQLDEKIIDMHTRVAKRLQDAAEEAAQEIAQKGGGAGVDEQLVERLATLEEKVGVLAKRPTAVGGPDVPGSAAEPPSDVVAGILARLDSLEEKIVLVAEGASIVDDPEKAPDTAELKRIMRERLEQFDEKLVDMHTHVGKRLAEVAEEGEKKIMTMADQASKTVLKRLDDIEEKVKLLVDMLDRGQ